MKVSTFCKDHNVQTGACLSCVSQSMELNNGKCTDPYCLSPA